MKRRSWVRGRGGRSEGRPRYRRWVVRLGLVAAFLLSISGLVLPAAASAATIDGGVPGYDISFPECHRGLPASPRGYLVVGVNGGRAFTPNPCFAAEYRWAASLGQAPSLYMNINYPSEPGLDQAANGPRGACGGADLACRAYNYGYNAARYADAYARASSAGSTRWWLDVELANRWSAATGLNARVIQGAIDYFQGQHVAVGIYSVVPMWQKIAGGYAPGVPIWVAQTRASTPALAYCGPSYTFGGGTTFLVQSWDGVEDVDYVCPGQLPDLLAGIVPSPAVAPAPAGAPAPSAPVVPSTGIAPLGATASGSLVAHAGGASVSYGFDYPGKNVFQTVSLDFWPHDPDVSNHLFVRVTIGGQEVARVHGTDTGTPGHLAVTFSAHSAGPAVVELTSYADPHTTPAVEYRLSR